MINNRIVIIGTYAESERDLFYTPFNNRHEFVPPLSGIELHGLVTGQLLRMALDNEPPIVSMAEWQEIIWIGIWCFAGGAIVYSIPSFLKNTLAVIAGLVLIYIIADLAFRYKIWLPLIPASLGWITSATLYSVFRSGQEWNQRKLLMQMFSCYVPKSVAEQLWNHRRAFLVGGKPKSERVVASVLFSDLKGFSKISETLDPESLISWLNRYMESMAKAVGEHHGIIDKFIGDAVMAVFGVPPNPVDADTMEKNAYNAVACAFTMKQHLEKLNSQWANEGLPQVSMRIGIATGSLIAGSLGGYNRLDYTVIGDTVNIASRLESYDKDAVENDNCRILICEKTFNALNAQQQFNTAEVGKVLLKGRSINLRIYRVLARTK